MNNDTILAEEQVLYLKTKYRGYNANLKLTQGGVILEGSTGNIFTQGFYTLFPFPQKKKIVFDLAFENIRCIRQVKHGLNKNVIEIVDRTDRTYQIVVKDFQTWLSHISPKLNRNK